MNERQSLIVNGLSGGPIVSGHRGTNDTLHGSSDGRFTIIVGDKTAGKSILLLNLGMTMAAGAFLGPENDWIVLNETPEPVLVLDCEMDYEMDFEPRALSWVSGVPTDMIRDGEYLDHPEMMKRIDRADDVLVKTRLYYQKVPPGDFHAARQSVRHHAAKYGVQRVVYDVIKYQGYKGVNGETAAFASQLNEIAKEFNVRLVAAAQADNDGRVPSWVDPARTCETCLYLGKISPDSRYLQVIHSQHAREIEGKSYILECNMALARMTGWPKLF